VVVGLFARRRLSLSNTGEFVCRDDRFMIDSPDVATDDINGHRLLCGVIRRWTLVIV